MYNELIQNWKRNGFGPTALQRFELKACWAVVPMGSTPYDPNRYVMHLCALSE